MTGADQPAHPSQIEWGWVLAVSTLLAALTLWRWLTFGAPFGGDWAQYLSHSRALFEGRAYGDIGYLFSPYAWIQGPPVFPPALPLVMAAPVALFGESLLVPRLLMHGLLAVFLVAAFRYFRRSNDDYLAWGTVALLGTSFLLSGAPNVVGSDLGMCACVWMVLLLVDRRPRWGWKYGVLIGFLGMAAIGFRVAAAPLIPAVAVWAVLHRRDARLSPWVVGFLWAATLVVVLAAFGPGEQSVGAAAGNFAGPVSELDGLARWLARAGGRTQAYRFAISETFLYPFPLGVANNVYHVLAVPLTLIGLGHWLLEDGRRLSVLFAVATAAMLAILPVWVGRYAWVLTPLVCYGLLRGISISWSRLPGGRARGSRIGCAFAVLVATLAAANDLGSSGPGIRQDSEDWRTVGSALMAGAPETDSLRVASNRPRVLTWYTRIPAAALPRTSLELFLEEAQRLGLTRVVLSTQQPTEPAYRHWTRWQREQPEVFRPLGEFGYLKTFSIEFDKVRPTAP